MTKNIKFDWVIDIISVGQACTGKDNRTGICCHRYVTVKCEDGKIYEMFKVLLNKIVKFYLKNNLPIPEHFKNKK